MVLLQRNQFSIISSTDGQKKADVDWFDEDINIEIASGDSHGSLLVVDYNLSAKTTLEYTIDGDNYISFEPIYSADYKKIRLYNNSKFNIRAKSDVTVHHCKIAED